MAALREEEVIAAVIAAVAVAVVGIVVARRACSASPTLSSGIRQARVAGAQTAPTPTRACRRTSLSDTETSTPAASGATANEAVRTGSW